MDNTTPAQLSAAAQEALSARFGVPFAQIEFEVGPYTDNLGQPDIVICRVTNPKKAIVYVDTNNNAIHEVFPFRR